MTKMMILTAQESFATLLDLSKNITMIWTLLNGNYNKQETTGLNNL